jgi:predicted nucleic acid-binding protein
MTLVVDSSVTMAWCFEDEVTPFTEQLLNRTRREGAFVPAIWPLEVANVLLIAERRQRLSEADREAFMQLLRSLPIFIDGAAIDRAFDEVFHLGRAYNLTSYDAAYLELSVRRQLPLATLDLRLRDAALALGVPLAQ